MSRYRRNGTPIGDRRVYVVLPGADPMVWEVKGYKFWEEVDAGLPMEIMMGKFGFERVNELVIIRPGANLVGAKMVGVDLWKCNLRGAKMRGADLRNAELDLVDLSDADLSMSVLREASITDSFMPRCNLSHSLMTGTIVTGKVSVKRGWRKFTMWQKS